MAKVSQVASKAAVNGNTQSDSIQYMEGNGFLNDRRLESFGVLLADYVLQGANYTIDSVDKKKVSISEGIISFKDQLWRAFASSFRANNPSTTYYVGFIINQGFVFGPTEPSENYMRLWTFKTDVGGNISLVSDNRGATDRVKFKAAYDGVYLNTDEVQAAIDNALSATLGVSNVLDQANAIILDLNVQSDEVQTIKGLADDALVTGNATIVLLNNALDDAALLTSETETAIANAEQAVTDATLAKTTVNQAITDVNIAKTNTETATATANTLVSNTKFVNVYAAGTTYQKNNVVSYNGSSFIALQQTTGNPPPTLPTIQNSWWALLSSKGERGLTGPIGPDGTKGDTGEQGPKGEAGSVISVNNIMPDEAGNVILPVNDSYIMVKDFTGANDSLKIQAALDFAFANNKQVVIAENREYNLTGAIKVRQNVELRGERATQYTVNGNFRVFELEQNASMNLGSIVIREDTFNSEVIYLDGKYQYGAVDQRTFLKDLDIKNFSNVSGGTAISFFSGGENHYIHYINLERLSIYNCAVGIKLKASVPTNGDAWVNANRFDKITISECIEMIVLESGITYPNDCSGNSFTNLQIQPGSNTQKILTITGEGNVFSGAMWDAFIIPHTNPIVEFKAESMFNSLDLKFLPEERVINLGVDSNNVNSSLTNRERIKWNNGFIGRDIEVRDTNWNDYIEQGVNQVAQHTPFLETLNQPLGAHTYGNLLVFDNNNSTTQMYFPYLESWLSEDQKRVYVRNQFNNGGWTTWLPLGLTETERNNMITSAERTTWNEGFLTRSTYVGDWNLAQSSGIYQIIDEIPFTVENNQPIGAETYGILNVFKNSNSIFQMYAPYDSLGNIYIRSLLGVNWSVWRMVGITSAERTTWNESMQSRFTVTGNWNLALEMGTYQVLETTLTSANNQPPGAYPYGILIVHKANEVALQQYIPNTSNAGIYTRSSYDLVTWTSWEKTVSTLEVRTSDPSNPAVGQMWLRSDL